MNPLGVAIVGLGVGEHHARAYHALNACRVRWLIDLDEGRARAMAEGLDGARAGRDLDAALGDLETHIVSIASYDDVHADQAVRALRAGKHVFVEKPLCRTRAELDRIRAEWEARPTRALASNLVLRASPMVRWLKRAVADGTLGSIYAIDGDYLYGRLEKITEGWRRDIDSYSVMLGGGIHLVDLMIELAGEAPVSVACAGSRICTEGTAFPYPDFAAATFRFRSGAVGRITANFGCVHRHQHVLRVFGTRATFVYDDQGGRLYRKRDPGDEALRPSEAWKPGKGDLIPEFVEAIERGRDTAPAARREFRLLEACLAADEALRTGREAAIP